MKFFEGTFSGIRVLSFCVGIGFIGFVVYSAISGPAAMQQLEEFEQEAAVIRAEVQADAENQMRDAVLSRDDWGQQDSVDSQAADRDLSASERRRRLEGLRESQGSDWGVAQ